MRALGAALVFLCAALPVAAQAHDHAAPAGGGKLPAGWQGRTDRADQKLDGVMFMPMGNGFHVKSGPAAILWNPAHAASGEFTAGATFTAKGQPATEAYGIVVAGKNLEKEDVDYGYFIIRGDGSYMIRHRAGSEVHTMTPWTKHEAVRTPDASGTATNTLSFESAGAKVRFLVNGTEVASFDSPPANPNGIVGLRVNHNLELMVTDLKVTKK